MLDREDRRDQFVAALRFTRARWRIGAPIGVLRSPSPSDAPESAPPTSTTAPLGCNLDQPIDRARIINSKVSGTIDRVSVRFTPRTLDQPTAGASR